MRPSLKRDDYALRPKRLLGQMMRITVHQANQTMLVADGDPHHLFVSVILLTLSLSDSTPHGKYYFEFYECMFFQI